MNRRRESERPGMSKLFMIAFVGVLVITSLITIVLWPVLQKPAERHETLGCRSNLRQLGLAISLYANDHEGKCPDPNRWCDLLLEHFKSSNAIDRLFVCPGAEKAQSHYAMNPNAVPIGPSDLVFLFDAKGGWNQCGGLEMLTFANHRGKFCNILFADYHVEVVDSNDVSRLKWRIEKETKPEFKDARPPKTDADLRYWLGNMVWHHQFTVEEIKAAAGLAEKEIEAAKKRFDIRVDNRPKRAEDAPLLVLPYPGGRHPRIGFLEGAIDPQRETKFSVFTPWDANSYVVVDVPEAIWSNLGLTYLAHTHIDTIWAKQGIELEKLEWNRHEDGRLDIERRLPNGISFGVKVKPTKDAVLMEMRLANGTGEKLSDLRIQNCVMTKMAKGFEQQTNENKVLKDPYAACRSSDGKRWIITAWQGCHRTWANEKCPCFHSDPKFTDLEPGQEATLKGWLSFYEGTDTEAELARIKETGWEEK